MEIRTISAKLLLVSIIIAVVFISIKSFLQRPNDSLKITICNEQDSLDIHIRYRGSDFLINPSSLKNVFNCISKSMPFYDRTIEYVINPSSSFNNGINNRYQVSKVVRNNKIKIGKYDLNMNSNKIIVTKENQSILIFKRRVNSIFELYLNSPSSILSIIRPRSLDNSEQLLKKISISQQVVKNGEYMVNNY